MRIEKKQTGRIDHVIIDRTSAEGSQVKIGLEVLTNIRKNNGTPVTIINQTLSTIHNDLISRGLTPPEK